jgi:hypothetical protein
MADRPIRSQPRFTWMKMNAFAAAVRVHLAIAVNTGRLVG